MSGRVPASRETSNNAGSVVIVVPTYNEVENLPKLVERVFSLGLSDVRMLVVDDGSPDGTGRLAEELGEEHGGRVEVIHRAGKQGLGTAYVVGFRRALELRADFVVEMDADLSHDPGYLPAFLDELENADVVVGSRYVAGGGSTEEWGALRKFVSGFGNAGIRTVAGLRVHDATSGFKAFRGDALEGLDLSEFRCSGFGFQAEVAHACQRRGYRVVEHPIMFAERASGYSKMSFGIMVEAAWRLLLLRWSRR